MNSQSHHGAGFDRDRDRDRERERELDEQRHRAMQQQDEIAHRERERERDQNERHQREPYPSGPPPHHSTAGSLPIHQPVASRISGAIHSPGGLLANHGAAPPPMPLGAPPGPAASFGGPLHGESGRPPPLSHGGQNNAPSQQHMFAPMPHGSGPAANPLGAPGGAVFGGPLQPEGGRGIQPASFGGPLPAGHPGPGGPGPGPGPGGPPGPPGGLSHGQQPILNDALSYLDQVKVQFHDQADVYNRFLDIMKDFKSQTIDTPGVINRVSDLFAGHPNLIQGFNTFLPPGYRIECGLENNPNSIRVTTPSGSTIHSIGPARTMQPDGPQGPAGPTQPYMAQRPGAWQQPQSQPIQHSVESPEMQFSAPAQNGAPLYNPPPGQGIKYENPSPALQHRPVIQGQNSAVATHGPVPRNAHTPTPVGGAPAGVVNGNAAAQQASLEKRGPVEFNHAISYVNKIKNRFQDKPEIYKQFLEILQTYQREQKPIQEVYAQVTTLFHAAPDLLEDFKQFLPESAAHTRPGGARGGDDGMSMTALTQTSQPSHAPRDGPKMPPVGNFAPPSAGKESKKRPRPDKPSLASATAVDVAPASSRTMTAGGNSNTNSNKRPKLSHKPAADGPVVEPTLTPVMPEPLAPTSAIIDTQEGLTFFDRVKKYVSNRTTLTEFLKLCNLYTQGLLDETMLVSKSHEFIGGNPELWEWFKGYLNYRGEDRNVENMPAPPTGKVSLSNCRGYGPSYRLLPKRERLKRCSGRDELCHSVLNDQWASHPTWASEDSGFVAHRKNGFEEGLHRIEEERHDYDFYIEANQKCIQLLEPIAQQMLTLSPAERANFKMPPALGGQSTSIYKRVLKKVYGLEKGSEVVNDMFNHPFAVVPIVMARLKQKDEEWRFTQREWEKVWLNQTEAMHLKSLDHMGIQVKANDKRNLAAKHLVDVIKTKYEEQRRSRYLHQKTPRYQFAWSFADKDLLLDLLRFMILHAMHSGQHSTTEKERIVEFFETFIPQFFDLAEEQVQLRLVDIDKDSGEEDGEEPAPAELSNGRSRRNGKKSDLLRGVLDPGRNGSKPRTQKEDSAASGSKETTPDVGSAGEEEMADAQEDAAAADVSNERWLPTVPRPTVIEGDNPLLDSDNELKADGYFARQWFNFFSNQTIFVFFSVFHTLYKRLKSVKESRDSVLEELRRENADKPGKLLGMVHGEANYFEDNSPEAFWPRTVELIEEYITGEIDENKYQDVLRHYYLKNGWTIYTISDLLRTLCRQALVCNNSDSKEKTPDLVHQFLTSRQQEETSYQAEIGARKFAEKCVKDGEMFVICWYPAKNEATVRWLQKDDTTFYMEELERRDRWQYYISSYMRVEPTEGVPRSRLQKSVLTRNLPAASDVDSESGDTRKPVAYSENLVLRICLNSSKIKYESGTADSFVYNNTPGKDKAKGKHQDLIVRRQDHRRQRFREKMVMNLPWMKGLSRDEVQKKTDDCKKWIDDGILPTAVQGNEVVMDTAE